MFSLWEGVGFWKCPNQGKRYHRCYKWTCCVAQIHKWTCCVPAEEKHYFLLIIETVDYTELTILLEDLVLLCRSLDFRMRLLLFHISLWPSLLLICYPFVIFSCNIWEHFEHMFGEWVSTKIFFLQFIKFFLSS